MAIKIDVIGVPSSNFKNKDIELTYRFKQSKDRRLFPLTSGTRPDSLISSQIRPTYITQGGKPLSQTSFQL